MTLLMVQTVCANVTAVLSTKVIIITRARLGRKFFYTFARPWVISVIADHLVNEINQTRARAMLKYYSLVEPLQ